MGYSSCTQLTYENIDIGLVKLREGKTDNAL